VNGGWPNFPILYQSWKVRLVLVLAQVCLDFSFVLSD
jgi:hypothetical protein